MGKQSIISSAVAGGASLLLGLGLPKVIEDMPVWSSWVLVGVGVALLLVAAGLRWIKFGGSESSEPTNTATARDGTALAGKFGDVHIYPSPAATQHPKDARGRASSPSEASPKRGMRISPDWRRASSGLPPREADFSMAKLVAMLRERRGPVPSDVARQREFWRQIGLDIADQVGLRGMMVWGRLGEVRITRILPADLDVATFDAQANTVSFLGAYALEKTVYSDVKFNREQVMEAWPRQ